MKLKKYLCAFCVISLMAILLTVPAFAAGGDVAGAVEQTWDDAATQIKTVVDNVVFPALSMILAIAFFVKLGMSYFDYRTRGQFEWTGPAILFVCLSILCRSMKNAESKKADGAPPQNGGQGMTEADDHVHPSDDSSLRT